MIKLVFFYYWEICLLKRSPENTPYSRVMLFLSTLSLVMVLIVQWQVSDIFFAVDFWKCVLAAISLIASYILFTFFVLFVKGLAQRVIQTLTSLFCTRIILHILAAPLLLIDPYLSQANLKNPLLLFIGVIYLFITLGLSVWQFVITAHIYKFALSTSAIQSVLAAFGVLAVNILTVSFWR